MMNRIVPTFLLGSLLLIGGTADVFSQANVERFEASKLNDYGVVYSLPRTEIEVEAIVRKETYQPGPFAGYARTYLGKSVKTDPSIRYSIRAIRVRSVGVADPEHKYVVEFRPGTVAPFVYLNNRGLICAINAGDGVEPYELPKEKSMEDMLQNIPFPNYPDPSFPQEYALAGSQSKKADIASKYLFDIREGKVDLMKGDVDAMPKDGASLKIALEALEMQEAATLALFEGMSSQEEFVYRVQVRPEAAMHNRTIFRFSEYYGPTSANDLSGAPVTMDLKVLENTAPQTAEEERKIEKGLKGIVYNVPGRAEVTISQDGKPLITRELPVVQFGQRQSLIPKLFKVRKSDNIQVVFDSETGSIQEIHGIQK